jgi:hypothetical protein
VQDYYYGVPPYWAPGGAGTACVDARQVSGNSRAKA